MLGSNEKAADSAAFLFFGDCCTQGDVATQDSLA